MGLNVTLETETGKRVGRILDPKGMVAFILYCPGYPTLRHIDPYGETVFNGLQMRDLIADLKRIHRRHIPLRYKTLLEKILHLAQRCGRQPHLYLRFSGD